jgi:hypothetical protein
MKTRILLIFISIIVISFLSCKREGKKVELPRIEYDVLINNYGNNYSWFDHIDGFQRVDLFGILIESAKTGKYKLEDMDGNRIDPATMDAFFQLPPVGDSATEAVMPMTKENLSGFRFREKWIIHKKTGLIEKEVIAICPVHFRHHPLTDSSEFAEAFPLFWIFPSESDEKAEEMVVTKNIAYDVYLDNTLPVISGAYGTKLPFYFFNIETSLRKEIINYVLDAGFDKKTPVYDFFMTPMSDQDLELLKEQKETVFYEDPKNPGTELDSIRITTLDRTQIVRLKFIEEWTLNKTSLKFSKRIIAVSPSVISYDEYGEFRGYKFLFWLVFDESRAQSLLFE